METKPDLMKMLCWRGAAWRKVKAFHPCAFIQSQIHRDYGEYHHRIRITRPQGDILSDWKFTAELAWESAADYLDRGEIPEQEKRHDF